MRGPGFFCPRRRRALGPTCAFATGSGSLDDVTAGVFVLTVMNGAAGTSKTDDSWQRDRVQGAEADRVWEGRNLRRCSSSPGTRPAAPQRPLAGLDVDPAGPVEVGATVWRWPQGS